MGRIREQEQDVAKLAAEFDVGLAFEKTRRGHVRAIFRGRQRSMFVVMTPGHGGDWRARLNNITMIRRKLRALTGRQEP